MQLNTHSAATSSHASSHTLGLMQHARIKDEVQSKIHPDKSYLIVDISSGGREIQKKYSGGEIRARYPQIFGDWLHGFMVFERGNNMPVFTYKGPIADRVFSIVTSHTFH